MSRPVDTRLTRRELLRRAGLAGAGAAVLAGLPRPPARADEDLAPFVHGVASGDPTADGVVIWTRVTPEPDGSPGGGAGDGVDRGPIEVGWVVARDVALTDVVASGTVTTTVARDYTVKVAVEGLEPATHWFYGFTALGRSSLTGRTRTAPAAGDGTARLRIASLTCAHYRKGFFNVYARVAERDDLDLVLHHGDYIYESDGEGDIGRAMYPDVELFALDHYRKRYGQYRLDPDLRRLHQLHPMAVVWDDHETVNDAWRDGSPDHDPETQGDFAARKRTAQRVYDEWLPIRLPDPDDPGRIWREHRYGDLLDILSLDTRLERDEHVQPPSSPTDETGVTDIEGGEGLTLLNPGTHDPDRVMISPAQRAWLHGALAGSQSRGVAWRVLHNQTMIMPWNGGGLPQLPPGDAGPLDLMLVRNGGNALNNDQWDGYVAERERLFDAIEAGGVTNVVALSGDIHPTFCGDLTRDPYDPTVYDPTGANPLVTNPGVEFLTPSVTNRGLFEEIEGTPASDAIAAAILADNPHMREVELDRAGYWVFDVTADRFHGDLFFVDTVLEPSDGEEFVVAYATDTGANRLTEREGPLPPAEVEVARPPASRAAAPSGDATPTLPATGGALPTGVSLAALAAAGLVRVRGRRPSS